MNSRGQFIIEGIKQAGKVFVASLLVLSVAVFFACLSAAGVPAADAPLSLFGGFVVITMIVAAVFGSALAGPVPWALTHFDISDLELLILSCLILIPYWALLGTLAGHIPWSFFCKRSQQEPIPSPCKISKQIRLIIEGFALVIAAVFFFDGPFMPHSGPGRSFSRWGIINNLQHIDAAKNQFALEHQINGGYTPTITDLSPYLRLTDGKFPRFSSEIYLINAISNPPCALLTNDLWIHRNGWWGRYLAGTNGQIFRLP